MEAQMDGLKKGMEAMMDSLNKSMEAKMDGFKNGMEAKINEKMKGNMEDMKNDLKPYMEGLTKLIQENIPNGENLVEETHDENKINFNCDFINSIVGLKIHHIPKIDMRNFDGNYPVTWILQMEQYLDLYNVKSRQKVQIATLYVENIHFYGINVFSLIKKLIIGQFLWRK